MTPYSEIFKAFLREIQDAFYIPNADQSNVPMLEQEMVGLLHKAIVGFSYPKVDIRDFDDDSLMFNVDLDIDEIEILATGMVLNWARTQLNDRDILTQAMTTKDFNTYSQAPHIRSLIATVQQAEARFRVMMVKYSVRNKEGGTHLLELR